jgi:probable HAF family extracellular repeat protein
MIAKAAGAALATLALSAGAAPAGYTLVDLGASHRPQAVNESGTIVGCRLTQGTCGAPEIYDGSWRDLKHSGTGNAEAINDKGVVVGEDGQCPTRWRNGHRLVLRGGLHRGSTAEGVSNGGTIVGTRVAGSDTACFAWNAGDKANLGSLGGGRCQAHAIDKTGRYIAGESYVTPGTGADHAFIHDESGMHDLGLLKGGAYSRAIAVDRRGHASVTADYDNSGDWTAAYWNGRKLVKVPGVIISGGESFSGAMNDNDEMLVAGYDGGGHFLFLYDGRAGMTTAVEPLIHDSTGWDFDWGQVGAASLVAGLNDQGAIVGSALYDGVEHGFMLVPDAE